MTENQITLCPTKHYYYSLKSESFNFGHQLQLFMRTDGSRYT